MEEWNNGTLEYWVEMKIFSTLSIIPSFHYFGLIFIRFWTLNFDICHFPLYPFFQNFLNPFDRLFDAGLVLYQCKPHKTLSILAKTDSRGNSHFSFH
jgi:hypothetical protein